MIGESVSRKEDQALLTGSARFLDDFRPPGMLHLGVIRSPHAHARIVGIDTSEAARLPGVVAVATAKDLTEIRGPIPAYKARRKFRAFEQPVLAETVVRHVGEALAVVVVEEASRLAEALEAVSIEYDPLTAASSIDAAMQPGAPRVHERWPDNIAHTSRSVAGDVESAMATADVVITERLEHPRLAAMPMETRGVLAYIDDVGALVVVSSTQHTYMLREAIADVLGLIAERIRVLAPAVGGGFGAKGQVYPEEILVPAMALRLGRPVKWVESRNEHFMATCHDREQQHEVRVGFRREGTVVAIDGRFAADFGAYPIQEDGVTINTVNHLCAPYKVANYRNVLTNVVTHKMFSAAYRGAGRPEAAFVMERILDIAARRLELDPAEIRRRNFVRPADMPYRPGLTYKDGVGIAYDPGDFPASLEKLLALFGYDEARALQRQRGAGIRRIGIGLACYLQGTGFGPYEGANVRVDPSGKVYLLLGSSSQGQSHATTLAQICAQELGVSVDDVVVVGGDTHALPYGFGAYASRIAANTGPAVARAARQVREKAITLAASMLEAAEADIRVSAGRAHVVGVPALSVPLAELARVAVKSTELMPDPGLNACTYFNPKTVTWAFGAQAAAVEVDTETCELRIVKYAALHDCGRPINPMVVDGQLHGGIAQGLGGALMEEIVYDETGQLRTGSFMDYALPRAADVPFFMTGHLTHPSMMNELGIKGVGESGAIAPGAVIANAVEDALADFGVQVRELPLTPARIFSLLKNSALPRGRPTVA